MTQGLYRATQFDATGFDATGEEPTLVQYKEFQSAYSFYNRALFDGKLPDVLIVMTRNPRSHGYLAPNRWKHRMKGDVHHELSLNPMLFPLLEVENVLSTLVHEMVHAWQFSFSEKPPRKGYHNREWADRMEEIGLIPSTTGEPGGKATGQSVDHYIDPDGPFMQATAVLLDLGFEIPYTDLPEETPKKKGRPKYTCEKCSTTVWGKSGLSLGCLKCQQPFQEQIPDDDGEEPA